MQTARRDWVSELGGNIAERIAQVGADQLERGDGGDGDQCRDQSILNGRDPGIVPAQVPKWRVGYHRLFLQLSGGTRRFLHKSYSKIMFTLLRVASGQTFLDHTGTTRRERTVRHFGGPDR